MLKKRIFSGKAGRGLILSALIFVLGFSLVPDMGAHAARGTTYTRRNGVDVSQWQSGTDSSGKRQTIDWTKMDNVEFALIRVGHRYGHDVYASDGSLRFKSGQIEEDVDYKYNFENAIANNIKVGAYIYSQAITPDEAREEADYIISRVYRYKIDLPIILDYEYESGHSGRLAEASFSKAQATEICEAFAARVKELGYTPMIYANQNVWTEDLDAKSLEKSSRIWLARWTTTHQESDESGNTWTVQTDMRIGDEPTPNSYTGIYDFWQYSSQGVGLAGIRSEYVDLDFWYDDGTLSAGKDYSTVFDADYYLSNYPDMKQYEGNPAAMLQHFLTIGVAEGRRGSKYYDPSFYRNKYSDLRSAFGDDWKAYFDHYFNMGMKEGREAFGLDFMRDFVTIYEGVDYKCVYDFNYYLANNPDLATVFGRYDDKALLSHYVNFGIREGRVASPYFDVSYYKENNADLKAAFGDDNMSYVRHFITYGVNEGRKTVGGYKAPEDDPGTVDPGPVDPGTDDPVSYDYIEGAYTIVLDPGHDDVHAGAQYFGTGEEDMTVKIGLYLREMLKKARPDINVVITRETGACPVTDDDYSCLNWRSMYSAASSADIYVSLHLNADASGRASGSLVFVPNESYSEECYEQGQQMGRKILDRLISLGLADYGLVTRDSDSLYPDGSAADYYAVIRNNKRNNIPAIIVEHAFLSNRSDYDTFINNEEGLQLLAKADCDGILEYIQGKEHKKDVFSAVYYAEKYPELLNGGAIDAFKLYKHFLMYGMNEKRQASRDFDPNYYIAKYPDLRSVFGDEWSAYYDHYLKIGSTEGRIGTGSDLTRVGTITAWKGFELSPVYDPSYYLSNNPGLLEKTGGDDIALIKDFVENGMREGKKGNDEFDYLYYQRKNPDLRMAFGTDKQQYYYHFASTGKAEGREGKGSDYERVGTISVLSGVDYSAVYDYDYYMNANPSLKKTFGDDDVAPLDDFIQNGMKKGVRASQEFDVNYYKNQYPDLQQIFGDDLTSYYYHYMNYGKAEGRIGAKPETNGVNN